MFCRNCGNQLDDKAVICTKCGCLTELGDKMNLGQQTNLSETPEKTNNSDGLGTVAKVFAIIGTAIMGIYLFPLLWTLPMTIALCKKLERKEPISVGFKVCMLLFVSTIAGILLLCRKDDNQ